MSVSRLSEVHLVVFFCSSIPVLLCDNTGNIMSKHVVSVVESVLHYRLHL